MQAYVQMLLKSIFLYQLFMFLQSDNNNNNNKNDYSPAEARQEVFVIETAYNTEKPPTWPNISRILESC